MTTLNMLEAKTQLCSLIKMLEDKEEDQFVICRNGKKIAQLTLFKEETSSNKRTGIANGLYNIDYSVLDDKEETADLLFGDWL